MKNQKEMSYDEAIELLGFTTPKSLEENAGYAKTRLANMLPNAPLRYQVACVVVIRAAK